MKETLIDIETYCEADIKKCGLYRYVSDPSFEILLIAWATDEGEGFGETKLADLASGDPFPQELLDDFKDSNAEISSLTVALWEIFSEDAYEKVLNTLEGAVADYVEQMPDTPSNGASGTHTEIWAGAPCGGLLLVAADLPCAGYTHIRQDCGRMIVYHSRLIYCPSDGNIQTPKGKTNTRRIQTMMKNAKT